MHTWKDGATATTRAATTRGATDTGTATSRVTSGAPHSCMTTRCERPIADVRPTSVASCGVATGTTAVRVTSRSEWPLACISGMTVPTIDDVRQWHDTRAHSWEVLDVWRGYSIPACFQSRISQMTRRISGTVHVFTAVWLVSVHVLPYHTRAHLKTVTHMPWHPSTLLMSVRTRAHTQSSRR